MSSSYVTHPMHLRKGSLDMRIVQPTPTFASVDEFMLKFCGSKKFSIKRVLIANNGIAAVKAMRSMRKWVFEMFKKDRMIKFVAMVTPEDMKANAEYIRMADQLVCVPGGTNNNNYANVQLILDCAKRMDVQAVWAGWGHASENPKLPEELAKHDIVFLGPPQQAMWALGDKIASTIIAQTAGVPTLPWSGSGLRCDPDSIGVINVPDELYRKATIQTVEEGLQAVTRIGLPVMIKASEGGGGKGIRMCSNVDDLPVQLRQVQAEIPGSPVFIMSLAKAARHLEVQVLADRYGQAISLFGRDCSIQRRHQKIIEEAPATIAPPEIFQRMERDAVKLSKLVGYVSAGTVEYLYLPDTREYFFLELNPRLQVEHPCTEIVSNINLPAAQLQVGMGVPLYRNKDIRLLYGLDSWGTDEIDFENPEKPPLPRGNVIACRITSENPDDGFKPSGGQMEELNFRSSNNVWGYFSVLTTGGLHEFADSQFGHCFSWGESRDDARNNMVLALKELSIRGDFRTTVEYLIGLLQNSEFINNDFHTAWLDALIASHVKQTDKPEIELGVAVCSVLNAETEIANSFQSFQNSLERYLVQIDNRTIIFDKQNDPTVFRSPSAGKLIRYLVDDGSHLKRGQPYAEMEVMKMIMTLTGTGSGILHYCTRPGAVLSPGQMIARLNLDDPNRVKRPILVTDPFVEWIRIGVEQQRQLDEYKPHMSLRRLVREMRDVFTGYSLPEPYFSARLGDSVDKLFLTLDDPRLPLFELQELLSVVSGRIPKHLEESIRKQLAIYAGNVTSVLSKFPSQKIANEVDRYAAELNKQDRDMFFMTTQGILQLVQRYRSGTRGHMKLVIEELLKLYLKYEQFFQMHQYDKSVSLMKDVVKDSALLTRIIFSRQRVSMKNALVQALVDKASAAERGLVEEMKGILTELSCLIKPENSKVALQARQVVISTQQPSYDSRHNQVESIFLKAVERFGNHRFDPDELEKLISSETSIFDVLHDFFFYKESAIRMAALEVYVRRAYVSYPLNCLRHHLLRDGCTSVVEFQFTLPTSHPNRNRRKNRGMTRIVSMDDQEQVASIHDQRDAQRIGVMAAFENFEHFQRSHKALLEQISLSVCESEFDHRSPVFSSDLSEQPINIVNVAIRVGKNSQLSNDAFACDGLQAIPTGNRRHHLYLGQAVQTDGQLDYRFFLRCIIRHADMVSKAASFDYMKDEGERVLLEAIEALEVAMSHPDASRSDCNHIFLNFAPCVTLDPQRLVDTVHRIVAQYGPRLWNVRGLEAELVFRIRPKHNDPPITMRLCVSNTSGYLLELAMYREMTREFADDSAQTVYETWDPQNTGKRGRFDGFLVNFPYQTKDNLQQRRYAAQKMGTTYAYDFPEMFRQAVVKAWKAVGKKPRKSMTISECSVDQDDEEVLQYRELVLDESGSLMECQRMPGENDRGMVAWKMHLRTPEFPDGRDIVVIANDITHLIGSFGTKEHQLYKQASLLSRKLGVPRLYIAANSGARIGMAEEVKSAYQIAWINANKPELGFKYLYLNEDDYNDLNTPTPAVICKPLLAEDGQLHYVLEAIIGKQDSLGVENLKGSGLIAGETSEAYRDVVTMSLVTCRTVGIGAYVVRLAQRIVQVENAHIILTGAPALNKLLGKEVYTSNGQLGGIQIMHNNGITHASVSNDFDGVVRMLNWLSYMAKKKGGPLPIGPVNDPIDRPVKFQPTKTPYDPRCMLAGRMVTSSNEAASVWESGFFDKGSWDEIMSAWARTTVVGRARLGGIPVGVIAVETRTVELDIPADPATVESESKMVQQAGQVWYPDSAYKTAQSIFDFNREGLPLFIFANWRGFSGGMKDMFDQVMKFGAYIVDGLRVYKQPVFVYIPPHGELRGGAWAVVDPSINAPFMEMYADPNSRGGVLEPEGIVEIKYRQKDLLKTIDRLDDKSRQLNRAINEEKDASKKADLKTDLKKRHEYLLPLYQTVAVRIADMHDTTPRMLAKNVITAEIEWSSSRHRFYWRLRRRLVENSIRKEMINYGQTGLDDQKIVVSIERLFNLADVRSVDGNSTRWDNDEQVALWLETQWADQNSQIRQDVDEMRRSWTVGNVRKQLQEKTIRTDVLKEMFTDSQFRLELKQMVDELDDDDRKELHTLFA